MLGQRYPRDLNVHPRRASLGRVFICAPGGGHAVAMRMAVGM